MRFGGRRGGGAFGASGRGGLVAGRGGYTVDMAVYLIRHGETAGNANRVVQFPETPLSETGLSQAARLGERLADAGIVRLIASDYARAHQTAEAIARTTGLELESEPLLRERNLGDLRGRPYADLIAEGIEPFADDYTPPAGESWEVFHQRVDRAWAAVDAAAGALAADAERHVAVVTHGLVKASVVSRLVTLGAGVADESGGWGNTGVTVLERRTDAWTATLLNCTAHL